MIQRLILPVIKEKMFAGKAIIIIGARQTGKTTLLNQIIETLSEKYVLFNCDEPDIRKMLTEKTSTALKAVIGGARVVLIDEAQRIKNIGITLKLITDQIKDVQLIATGSSSFELSNEISEPLTGRKWEYMLFPVSTEELVGQYGELEEKRMLEHRLVYGFYPEVITRSGSEREILQNLTDGYLYKDIFNFQELRKPELISKLLEALALQIGSQVSYNELAQTIGADVVTVQRYIELLEKTFVIFRLRSFSRNVRNELKKSRKIYFYDNGVRNTIISNFNTVALRTDAGALWENFLLSERMKYLGYGRIFCNHYFWRTTQKQEIDYIEERDGSLYAFEFKWNPKAKLSFPKTFIKAYTNSQTSLITPENYLEFITKS